MLETPQPRTNVDTEETSLVVSKEISNDNAIQHIQNLKSVVLMLERALGSINPQYRQTLSDYDWKSESYLIDEADSFIMRLQVRSENLACPFCGNTKLRQWTDVDGIEYVECSSPCDIWLPAKAWNHRVQGSGTRDGETRTDSR